MRCIMAVIKHKDKTINVKPIKTEADYQETLTEIENLFDAKI